MDDDTTEIRLDELDETAATYLRTAAAMENGVEFDAEKFRDLARTHYVSSRFVESLDLDDIETPEGFEENNAIEQFVEQWRNNMPILRLTESDERTLGIRD